MKQGIPRSLYLINASCDRDSGVTSSERRAQQEGHTKEDHHECSNHKLVAIIEGKRPFLY
jgi:hypothetical protein